MRVERLLARIPMLCSSSRAAAGWGLSFFLPLEGSGPLLYAALVMRGSPRIGFQGAGMPAQGGGAPELVPHAVLVLRVGAAVVHHDVAHGADARRPQRSDQRLQLLLAAVAAVELVQLARQVPLQRGGHSGFSGTGRRPHLSSPAHSSDIALGDCSQGLPVMEPEMKPGSGK